MTERHHEGHGNAHAKIELEISGMHCQSCAKRVEDALATVEGVASAHVNGATNIATIQPGAHVEMDALLAAVKGAGYSAALPEHRGHTHDHSENLWSLIASLLCALPFIANMIAMLFGHQTILPLSVQWVLATIVQVVGGYSFYRDSFKALRNGAVDMNTLIAMGTTAAWGMSTVVYFFRLDAPIYFESSVFIIAFVLIGRGLEFRFKRKATEALRKLLQLQPRIVHIERDGVFVDNNIEDVAIGDHLQVLVGERVPVDGVVVDGDAEVDESMMTGESRPVRKIAGSKVFAGTLNNNGMLRIAAQQVGSDTLLAHIVRMVSQAQNSRAPAQKLADKISSWFVPAVIATAAATFLAVWLRVGDAPQALLNSISVLVIACPCALGLATPIVIVVAAGIGATMGILFKDAEVFEKARSMKVLFVDKTGTLTTGAMDVSGIYPSNKGDETALLSIAASLEKQLKHPLAQAVVNAAEMRGVALQKVESFMAFPGKGVEAKVGGQSCGLGSLSFAQERRLNFEAKELEALVKEGETPVVVWKEGIPLGFLVVADRVRDNAATAVEALTAMGVHVVMITGDRLQAAKAVAESVGITDYRAGLLPQDKLAAIEKAKGQGRVVGMLGDGINDAPASPRQMSASRSRPRRMLRWRQPL